MSEPVQTTAGLRAIVLQPAKLVKAKILDHLDEQASAFLAVSPFLLLLTSGTDGRIDVSPRGDEPGFVRIEDARTIVLPSAMATTWHSAFRTLSKIRTSELSLCCPTPGKH
jgi:hypothetical protein